MSSGKPRPARHIDNWTKALGKLYEKPDINRTPEEIWIATMAHCSAIGEAIRRSHYVELMDAAAHAFCWLLTFVHKCNVTENKLFRIDQSLCEIVYLKYPGVCGHCMSIPCKCNPLAMDKKTNKGARYKELYDMWERQIRAGGLRYSLHDWLQIFRGIFGSNVHLQTLESIGFHFLEEAGEEAYAIRKLLQLAGVSEKIRGLDLSILDNLTNIEGIVSEYTKVAKGPSGKPDISLTSKKAEYVRNRLIDAKMDLIIELADTFSWFCAILVKFDYTIHNLHANRKKVETLFKTNLEDRLIEIYGLPEDKLICPTCSQTSCKCAFFPTLKGKD